ncbi:MAG: hypothetical protein ACI96M_003322 [Candidatus Azotimanducaceae bacterium]|jgi:hypothetical protein
MISDPISSLTIVIEFAVGLVGFSGVIAAFLTIACLEHATLITAARNLLPFAIELLSWFRCYLKT